MYILLIECIRSNFSKKNLSIRERTFLLLARKLRTYKTIKPIRTLLYPPIPIMIDNHEGYTFRYITTFTVDGVDYTSINETTAVKPNDKTFYFFNISVPSNNGLGDIEQAHESVKSVTFTP